MKKRILYWQDPNCLPDLYESLKANKVSIVATDTIFGLMANADYQSVEQLDLIKNRCNKPYILLFDSLDKVLLHIENLDKKIIQFLKKCWPGPVTIIFKLKKNHNFYMKRNENTIGVRIPNHPELLKLLKNFDGLFSTSANISGEPAPKTLSEINENILKAIDLVVLDKNAKEQILPSTILDCTGSKIKIIREGLYPIDKLEELYGEKFVK